MGTGYWLLRPWRHAFDFSGRSPRREYWLFWLQFFLLVLVPALVMPVMRDVGLGSGGLERDNTYVAIAGVVMLVFLAPGLAVAVRRLHDQDKSGLMLLLWFVPAGGLILLVLMLLEGTQGENIHGPDPREDAELTGVSEVFE